MPRYSYYCEKCEISISLFHGINETINNCEKCKSENTMKKMLSTPIILNNKDEAKNISIGQLTKEYIKANEEILKEQKEEAKKDTYEPS